MSNKDELLLKFVNKNKLPEGIDLKYLSKFQEYILDNLSLDSNPKLEGLHYSVYPDSERLELSDKNEISAVFRHKRHAEKFGEMMWGKFFIVE